MKTKFKNTLIGIMAVSLGLLIGGAVLVYGSKIKVNSELIETVKAYEEIKSELEFDEKIIEQYESKIEYLNQVNTNLKAQLLTKDSNLYETIVERNGVVDFEYDGSKYTYSITKGVLGLDHVSLQSTTATTIK